MTCKSTQSFLYNHFWWVKSVTENVLMIDSVLGTKLTQAKKFNDPDDPCKILVATDAIGMGLNL